MSVCSLGNLQNTVITDCNLKHIRGQVTQGPSSISEGFRVDQPSFLSGTDR
jgi:hypothetical protein